jgi:tripartite-type tricarboxylate transporter receptor subunit TctC
MPLIVALTAALMLAASPTVAQTFPEKTVTIVVGASPGGSTDFSARLLADPLAIAFGKPCIVENKAGASGNIAATQVARSRADGHTMLMQYSGYHVGNPHLFDKMPWELKDFAPVAVVTFSPHVIAVHPAVKANNLKELAELAKASPGDLRYGSSGNGSIQHLAMEMFAQMTGVKLTHVPYKGAAPAVIDVIGGRVEIMNTTPPSLVSHIRAAKLKALAYTSDKRHPLLSEIPTSAEAGLPGYEVASWFGILVPAKTPPKVIDRLSNEIRKIVETDEFRRKVEEQGAVAAFMGPEDFKALIDKEFAYWGSVIKTAGIKGDE